MIGFFIQVINQFGYVGLGVLMSLEVGSEAILPFAGYLTLVSDLTVLGVIVATTIGSIVGSVILYWVGYAFSLEVIIKIFDNKVGRFFHLNEKNLTSAEKWFEKYEYKAVFFGRLVPVLRAAISIPAGMTKMNFGHYLILTAIGNTIWNIALIFLGRSLGSAWEKVTIFADVTAKIILIIILLAIMATVLFYTVKSKRKGEENE